MSDDGLLAVSFSTAVPTRGQTSLIPSDLSPKRDWGPGGVYSYPVFVLVTVRATIVDIIRRRVHLSCSRVLSKHNTYTLDLPLPALSRAAFHLVDPP